MMDPCRRTRERENGEVKHEMCTACLMNQEQSSIYSNSTFCILKFEMLIWLDVISRVGNQESMFQKQQ